MQGRTRHIDSKAVSLTYKVRRPAGNYTIEGLRLGGCDRSRGSKYLVVAIDFLVAWLRDAPIVAAETGLAIQVRARVALTVEFLQPHLLVLQRRGTAVRKTQRHAHKHGIRHTRQREAW